MNVAELTQDAPTTLATDCRKMLDPRPERQWDGPRCPDFNGTHR